MRTYVLAILAAALIAPPLQHSHRSILRSGLEVSTLGRGIATMMTAKVIATEGRGVESCDKHVSARKS